MDIMFTADWLGNIEVCTSYLCDLFDLSSLQTTIQNYMKLPRTASTGAELICAEKSSGLKTQATIFGILER